MREKIVTESGSIYIVDYGSKTWKRSRGDGANTMRTERGEFNEIYFTRIAGEDRESIVLICPPLNPEAIYREITSTPIISREKVYETSF